MQCRVFSCVFRVVFAIFRVQYASQINLHLKTGHVAPVAPEIAPENILEDAKEGLDICLRN